MPFKSKEQQAAVMLMLGGQKHKVGLRFHSVKAKTGRPIAFRVSAHVRPRDIHAARDLQQQYQWDMYALDNLDPDTAEVGHVSTETMPTRAKDFNPKKGIRRGVSLPFVTGSYLLPAARHKGLGLHMYRALAKYIARNSEYPGLASLRVQRNDSSNALWRRFKEKGLYGEHDILPGKPYKKKGTQ